MEQELSLVKIGSNVNINIELINENLSDDLRKQLSYYPYGKVVGYKITDGVGLGLILELEDGAKYWFFEEEIYSKSNGKELNKYNISSKRYIQKQSFNYSRDINAVLNPLNFIKWLRISFDNVI